MWSMSCAEFEDYLVGVVLGDGDLYYDKRRGYRVRITDSDNRYLSILLDKLEHCYKVRGRIYKHKEFNAYILVIWNKQIYTLVKEKAKTLLESPTKAFVGGIFDAEGGVNKTRYGLYRLYITTKNQKIAKAVMRILEQLGVKYYVTEYKDGKFRIAVHGIDRIRYLLDVFPIHHPKIRDKFQSFFLT